MRELSKSIPVGQASDFPVVGNYIRIDDSVTVDLTIEITQAKNPQIIGNKITMTGGDGVRFDGEFTRFTVAHSEISAQAVTVLAGFGEKASSKLSGSVTATDAQADTLAVAAVTVANTATALAAASTTRKQIVIQNNGANPIAVGPAGVTYATGFLIPAGGVFVNEKSAPAAWYGITNAGTENARVLTGE